MVSNKTIEYYGYKHVYCPVVGVEPLGSKYFRMIKLLTVCPFVSFTLQPSLIKIKGDISQLSATCSCELRWRGRIHFGGFVSLNSEETVLLAVCFHVNRV